MSDRTRGTMAALLGVYSVALCSILPPLTGAQATPVLNQGVTIGRTFVHVVRSKLNGREYRLTVALPPSYASATATRYPVLYLLDGGQSLPAAAINYRFSHVGSDSLIMVGVGFVDPAGGMSRRVDYTLPASPRSEPNTARWARLKECCEAAQTNRVFREELIPFIDSAYRTTADRGIFGHSHGGLFATYLLFADPDLFQRYAISSPALWWDHSAIFEHEAAFARSHTRLPKRVVIAVGAFENPVMVAGAHRIAATLQARNYEGLDLSSLELEGAVHSSMVTYSRVLDLLYPSRNTIRPAGDSVDITPARQLAHAFLAAYAGHDFEAIRRHLAPDSVLQAIVAGALFARRDSYLAALAEESRGMSGTTLRVDTLRVSSDDSGMATAMASYTQLTRAASTTSGPLRRRIMLELVRRPEGWRITSVLHLPTPASQVVALVNVEAGGRPVAGAVVTVVTDAGPLATARTDVRGISQLPYDWHISHSIGYVQVQAPGYALGVVPLPTEASVTVRLHPVMTMDSVALEKYVGTFVDTTGSRTRTVRVTRVRSNLIIEGLSDLNYASAEFVSTVRIALRDGTEIAMKMDETGRATELHRGGSRFVRK